MKMLFICCRLIFLLIFSSLGIYGENSYAGMTIEMELANTQTESEVQTLISISDFNEMSSLIKQWAEVSSLVFRESLYATLSWNMRSKQVLVLDGTNETERHDLRIVGGRCTWALEKLLGREVPAITRTTSDQALSDAIYAASDETWAALQRATPAIDVASLDWDEKLRLAKSSKTPENVLAKLAGDSDVRIRRAVAVNHATPYQVLYELSQTDADAEVRAKARKNSETAKVTFFDTDKTTKVKQAEPELQTLLSISDYKEMSSLIKQWAEVSSPELRASLYATLWLKMDSKQVLTLDGMDETERHDLRIAGGRCTWALEKLLGRELPAVARTSTDRALTEASRVAYLEIEPALKRETPMVDVASMNADEKLRLAKSPKTPENVLTELAVFGDVRIRRAVAANPATSKRVLHELFHTDDDDDVREKAYKNYKTAKSF